MTYRFTNNPAVKPENPDQCAFGKNFTDHMLSIKWNKQTGWSAPEIHPLENISLHPATSVLHYATEVKDQNLKGFCRRYVSFGEKSLHEIRPGLPPLVHYNVL